MKTYDYIQETKSPPEKLAQRKVLYQLFAERPMPDDQLLVNLGLYMRSSALAKVLFLNELYEYIRDIPGVIMEFGTWWGQNLVLFEHLRAIYEPFNQTRRVIGFDTFQGYHAISANDVKSETIKVGGYAVEQGYQEYLERLLTYHESDNVLSNIKKHVIVQGDVTQTVPAFFKNNPETVVALAYFDLALYQPTRVCLEAVKAHLIKGSVLMLDELNNTNYPGETIAFREVFGSANLTLRRSRYIADRTIAIVG